MTSALEPIVIGVGGNVGAHDAIVERFRRARAAIAELGDVRSAPLYRTTALRLPGSAEQPDFLNTALRVRIADVQPAELIATLLELERLLGRTREREVRWGPRAIDLDVLVWGDRVITRPPPDALEVPHPRLAERRFALEPLVALLGEDFEIPGAGRAGALLERVRDQQVELVVETW